MPAEDAAPPAPTSSATTWAGVALSVAGIAGLTLLGILGRDYDHAAILTGITALGMRAGGLLVHALSGGKA